MSRPENLVLFPLSQEGYPFWKARSKGDIRAALRAMSILSPSREPTLDESNISTRTMSFSRNPTESV